MGLLPFGAPPTTTAKTQSVGDNSTKIANTSFVTTAVNNAIAGVNPAVAVQAATNAILPNSPTYSNGVAGVGATLTTATTNTALVVDGFTPALNDRILVKNQGSAFQNGVYFLSTLAALGVAWILTRASDYNTPSDMNNTGAIPVVNGTANTDTSWVQTSQVTTVGTDAVTFTQFTLNPTTLVTLTGSQALTNKDLTGAGNTFPTFNQNTSGSAAKWTTARNLAGNSVDGSADVTFANKFIVQGTADSGLSGAQFLGSLSTGIMKVTTTTGVISSVATTGTGNVVLAAAPAITGAATADEFNYNNNAITASGNAATVPVTFRLSTVTNNSAAALTITITTTSAVDGQLLMVRILDFSAVAQNLTWVNTENSTVTAPIITNGSTTLFLTVGFIYNAATSKWRAIASA